MSEPSPTPSRAPIGSLAIIAIVAAVGAAAFAYTAGWFSPRRLTPDKMVDALAPPGGAARPSPQPCQGHLLYRRLRSERGRVRALAGAGFRPRPVSGPRAVQSRARPIRTRRMRRCACGAWDCGSRRRTGRQWRSAMIDPPFFPVSTPQAFYELLLASGSKDPNAMKTFAAAHPEIRGVRCMGQERALDRQLCGRAVQQPQQLHLRRQFRRRACGALVAAAGGATGRGLARRSRQARPRLPGAGDHRAGRQRRRSAGPWW